MKDTIIRHYKKNDSAAIKNIIFKTGFYGKDLTEKKFFDDKQLFFLKFSYYYLKYESENCFVEVKNTTDTIMGYILGTGNTPFSNKKISKKDGMENKLL